MKKSTMAAVLCLLIGPSMAQAQVGTAFTYQGRLGDGASPRSQCALPRAPVRVP